MSQHYPYPHSHHQQHQQQQQQQNLPPPPPPPISNAPLSSPLRRQRVAQPPTLLTTSIQGRGISLPAAASSNGGGVAPLSTTSLSSPFSLNSASAYPASPANASSPMALRGGTPFTPAAPYNPQQWGPIGSDVASPVLGQQATMNAVQQGRQQQQQQSRQVMYAPRLQGPDEPMGSPPPPYSADSNTPSSADPTSPETEFSMGNTPTSAATTMSPGGATITIGIDRRSPNPMTSPVVNSTAFPPPPTSGGRARSSSRTHADRLLSGIGLRSRNSSNNASTNITSSPTAMESLSHNTQQLLSQHQQHTHQQHPQYQSQQGADTRPPSARRAASTGAIGTTSYPRAPLLTSSSSDAYQQQQQEPREYGMPLPPPPPGPPPNASRSQSLNRPSDTYRASDTSRPLLAPRTRQPPPTTTHGSTALGPVPPTPADWREDNNGTPSNANAPNNGSNNTHSGLGVGVDAGGGALEHRASSTPQPQTERQPWQPPLHIQTDNLLQSQLTESPASASAHPGSAHPGFHARRESGGASGSGSGSGTSGGGGGGGGGLIRSPAVRNRSAKGLRERRSESRTGRVRGSDGSMQSPTDEALSRPLADIDVGASGTGVGGGGGAGGGRRASARNTPRSGRGFQGLDEALTSAELTGPLSGPGLRSGGSGLTTPYLRDEFEAEGSPYESRRSSGGGGGARGSLDRPRSRQGGGSGGLMVPPSPGGVRGGVGVGVGVDALGVPTANPRPLSHILHAPNEEAVRVMPLSPESTHSLMDFEPESPKTFLDRALQRHKIFLQKEARAKNDEERLWAFAEYVRAESRIRREKYDAVFKAEGIEPRDLTEGMFELPRPPKEPVREANVVAAAAAPKVPRPESAQESSRRSSGTSFEGSQNQSHSQSRPPSTTASSDHVQLSLDTTIIEPRGKNFVPCLSPIQSMSAVTGRDGTESRGRAPSRWWESQSNPSQQGEGFDVLKRSKRESKYMSALIEDSISPVEPVRASSSRPPDYSNIGPNEYPPEKTGWHEQSITVPQRRQEVQTPLSAPFTPDPRKLDISRLITLPPPYPRRHPAVNNSHPGLADIRSVVRSLHEFPEAAGAKTLFDQQVGEKRKRADSWTKHQKSLHDQDVQFRIEQNSMTQEEYDHLESDLEAKIAKSARDLAQDTFDLFQSTVTKPIHPAYDARITRATQAFDALAGRLISDTSTHSPNLAQEGGDEQPELLEKLTMLKWLFEAREALHRAQHDLLTERNTLYEAVVTLPYAQANNAPKLAETRAFFAQDKRRRGAEADRASLARHREFAGIIETHVTRGVEVQLSAFWDIAPGLQSLLQRVPDAGRLGRGFEILIPKDEVEENPVYWEHPLRYLYSVLSHAEASSRQFVEAQVSLWCLLQEVREAAIGARWRSKESRGAEERGEDEGEGLDWREQREKQGEIQRGVDDLKEKVGAVEQQWVEGLGGEITRVREAVREYLEATGGDEELDEHE